MTTRTIYFRYRHKWAHGVNKWEYSEITVNESDFAEALGEVIDEMASEFSYSDKYRGIDYEVIEKPPEEWIRQEIERSAKLVTFYTERQERLRALLP